MAISTVNVSSNMDLETKHQFIKDVIAECEKVLVENTGNRCAKYCKEYLASSDGKDMDSRGKMNDPVPHLFHVALNQSLYITHDTITLC